MTQTTFPEIQAAAQALESRIALTEAEVEEMKAGIKAKKELLKPGLCTRTGFRARVPFG